MLKTIPPTTNCGCGYFKSKCAEIHYQTSSFSILCIFCGLKTDLIDDFIDHFHSFHLEDFIKSIQCTNEPIVEQNSKHRKLGNYHDPLQIDQIIADPEEQILEKLKDCDKFDDFKQEKTEDCDEDSVGDKDTSENDDGVTDDHIVENQVNSLELKEKNVPENKLIDSGNRQESSTKPSDISRKERNVPLICSHCGREFKRSYQLAYHINIHTGAKPFQCEVCGKQFKARTTLTRHLTTHEQRMAFACEFCHKSFTHKAAFLSHKLRHTQIRSFKCDQCEKFFYTCNQVETHKRKMHACDDSDLPFACDMCGKHYRTASMLSTHRHKKHFANAPFACDKCEKKFIDEKQLQIHKTIHTETYTFNH